MVMWESGKINVVSVELSIMYMYTSGPLVSSKEVTHRSAKRK